MIFRQIILFHPIILFVHNFETMSWIDFITAFPQFSSYGADKVLLEN